MDTTEIVWVTGVVEVVMERTVRAAVVHGKKFGPDSPKCTDDMNKAGY